MSTHVPHLVLPVTPERDHIRGPVTAPITLLEYGDYECPYCGAAHPIVHEVRRRMGKRLCFVYRHFPLRNVHPHAELAAEAAEAAAAPGPVLGDARPALRAPGRAERRGSGRARLDVERFARELADGAHAPKVRHDFVSGVRSGVKGTPCFYINGVRRDGQYDLAALLGAVEAVLRAA